MNNLQLRKWKGLEGLKMRKKNNQEKLEEFYKYLKKANEEFLK